MNIKDLIETLKAFPADARVLVQGYENGFDDIVAVKEISVAKCSAPHPWDGEYEKADKDAQNAIPSVIILGNRR